MSISFPGGTYWFDGPDDAIYYAKSDAIYAKSESGWIYSKLFIIMNEDLEHCGSQQLQLCRLLIAMQVTLTSMSST